MSGSRTINTKRNIIFSYVDTLVTLIFQFISRTIIVQVLGNQYLGISGLFTSILHVLNMAELGFSGAIVYNMYRPIAENDIDKVCSLLNYYRKIYRIVSLIILAGGTVITPFLTNFIKDPLMREINIYLLYFLYLLNTAASYAFFAYKTALLNALQRMDLSKIAYTTINLIQYILQILCLIFLRNYYLFVVCMILGTIFKNVFAAYISDRMFPQYVCKGDITRETKDDIISKVKGLLVCNISNVTYTTFDSIILSSFVGLTSVAIYNNYIVVFNGISSFISMFRNAMQASVGNSVATESKEKNYKDMLLWQFLFSVIATWCATCMVSLYQPFMVMWMGRDMLLPMTDVNLLCSWFFVSIIQHSYYLYLTGNGFWWEMRWPYILSTVANLVMNIGLGKIVGIAGIIFSSFFSSIVFGFIWQSSIILNKYFKKSVKEFCLKELYYFTVCIASCALAYFINQNISVGGIAELFVRVIICTLVAIGLQLACYFKMPEFRQGQELVLRVINR